MGGWPRTTIRARVATSVLSCTIIAQAQERDVDAVLARINAATERSEDAALSSRTRSDAIDEAIELRSGLIDAHPEDRRRATWHADQAEDLLLKRIMFPSDWHMHLLNADPACTLMPPEIPVIVGRGIQEAALAREAAVEDIRRTEQLGAVLDDPVEFSLLDRLRFEEAVRAPLLEAIGLILASGIDPAAGERARSILLDLDIASANDEKLERIRNRWLLVAFVQSGDGEGIESLVDSMDDIENDLDRVRATAVTQGARSAASLASRRFQFARDEDSYRRMLLGDLRERHLSSMPSGDDEDDAWKDRGDLWIRLLDTRLGRTDWSIDAAIAARLCRLADELPPRQRPLAVEWAVGHRELARRSRGIAKDQGPRRSLEASLDEAPKDAPARARSLWVLSQLALDDGDRLAASAIEERLYQDHPDSPVASPARVADLVEPWARRGDEDAVRRYDRALRASIDRMPVNAPDTERSRQQERLLQLARHLSENGRGPEAREIHLTINPMTSMIAAMLIESSAVNTLRMHHAGMLDASEVRPRYREIRNALRQYAGRFGREHPEFVAAAARNALCEGTSSLTLQPRDQDVEMVDEVAADDRLDDTTRIEAHFIRHDLRMRNKDTQQQAILERPDITSAIRLNKDLAATFLIERAASILDEIELERGKGNMLKAETIAANTLRPVAAALDMEMARQAELMGRITIARAFNETGRHRDSLRTWEGIEQEQPTAYVVLEGKADAMFSLDGAENMRNAMLAYQRLGQGRPGQHVPPATWWNAQLKQLLILEKVGRSLERIAPRIERLRLEDPTFGGFKYRHGFEALLMRQE